MHKKKAVKRETRQSDRAACCMLCNCLKLNAETSNFSFRFFFAIYFCFIFVVVVDFIENQVQINYLVCRLRAYQEFGLRKKTCLILCTCTWFYFYPKIIYRPISSCIFIIIMYIVQIKISSYTFTY